MIVDDLYRFAEQEGHDIVTFSLPETESIAIQFDTGKCCIGLDVGLHGIDLLEHLAHEVGHCETGTFYGIDTDAIVRAKCEHKANRWAYEHLVPYADLFQAYREGYRSVWDLAEYFGISCEMMYKILKEYYR